jgi:parallel beta-helix repeat protein
MIKKSDTIILIALFAILLPFNGYTQDYNILEFGATPDGVTLNTSFIQKAIDKASSSGGGRVIVPKGVFLTGSIILKSNVELHLKRNAILLGSTNPEDYKKFNWWKAVVMGNDAENVSISGKGVIDGQGSKLGIAIDSLFYVGQLESRYYDFVNKRPKEYMRPQLLEFVNCRNVRVSSVTLKNASSWVQTYLNCNGVVIEGIKVRSDSYWNNDGIDILDSKNVTITNCDVNSGDDGICLKSIDRTNKNFCDSIVISNCKVRSSASAVKFGTAADGDMRNVLIENIKVRDTYRSAIAIEAVQQGTIENVLVRNIKAKNTGNAIFLRVGRIRNAKNQGVLKNVTIQDVKVKVPFERPDYKYNMRGPVVPGFHNVHPSSITGLPGNYISNVTLENITIIYPGRGNQAYASMPLDRISQVPELEEEYPEFSMFGELPAWGFYIRHADGITFKNLSLKVKNPDYRTAIVLDDVKNFKLEGLKVKGDLKPPLFHKKE